MRTSIYEHRSGLRVIPKEILDDVICVIEDIHPVLSKNTVTQIKKDLKRGIEIKGWAGEYRLDANSKITISSYLNGVGMCVQTGNVSRIYADLLKLQALNPAAWQNTTNEELGQFILSFVYQKPGTARGSKSSICGNKERYSLLFGKKYNSNFLGDLLKIKTFYKLWATKTKKEDDGLDTYKVGLVNNGMFFVTAIIGVVCKFYYHPDYVSKVNASIMTEQKIEVVSQHDIDHHLFQPAENLKENLFALFEYCYQKFYRPGYEFLKSFKERYNNYSNFTKINNNYTTYVFRQIAFAYGNGIPTYDMEFLGKILFHPTSADTQRDTELLEKYVNVVFADLDAESSIPEETVSVLKDALTDYRTKAFKLHRVKPYEVFKNLSRDRIAKFAPRTLEELRDLRCLDEAQLTLYGEEIIDVVNGILNK